MCPSMRPSPRPEGRGNACSDEGRSGLYDVQVPRPARVRASLLQALPRPSGRGDGRIGTLKGLNSSL